MIAERCEPADYHMEHQVCFYCGVLLCIMFSKLYTNAAVAFRRKVMSIYHSECTNTKHFIGYK